MSDPREDETPVEVPVAEDKTVELKKDEEDEEESPVQTISRLAKAWKIGYGVAIAAGIAYGALRPGGEEEAKEAKAEVEATYKENAKLIRDLQEHSKANAKEIATVRAERKVLGRQLALEFKSEVEKLRNYMDGYMRALSRVPARVGGGNQRVAEELEKAKEKLRRREAELKAEKARAKAVERSLGRGVQVQRPTLSKPRGIKALRREAVKRVNGVKASGH